MGLAMAAEHGRHPAHQHLPLFGRSGSTLCTELATAPRAASPDWSAAVRRTPRVVDLSALWAGPLAAHLLWLAGAEVVKVESRSRPDAMRNAAGDVLCAHQPREGHGCHRSCRRRRPARVAFTHRRSRHRHRGSKAARARATRHRCRSNRARHTGLVWISITAHGATGEPAGWVGFGDDCGVSGGLSAALRSATGRTGFVGDALADPLTGIFASLAAWEAWISGRGVRLGLAMSHVVARCLAAARYENPDGLHSCLRTWEKARGQPFPKVTWRAVERSPAVLRRHSGVFAATAREAQTRPDTRIEAPVMARAAWDDRNTITSASAWGATQRVKSAFGMSARLAGVSMMVGRTALTLIPLSFNSSARASVSLATPAFEAV